MSYWSPPGQKPSECLPSFLSVICLLQISFWQKIIVHYVYIIQCHKNIAQSKIQCLLNLWSSMYITILTGINKSHCMSCRQTYHMRTFRGLEEVLYLFEMIRIQDGYPGFWMAKTFSTSSPELLHLKLPDLS
jgi:hypothetical protein